MPRRYHAYPPEFQVLNVLSTAGASILAVGYLLPLDLPRSGRCSYGEKRRRRTRGAPTGLEWQTPSPPPTDNFDETPVVTEGAYDYTHQRGGRQLPDVTPAPAAHRPPVAPTWPAARHEHPHHPAAAPLRRPGAAARSVDARHVGVPGHRDHVLRRPVHGLPGLPVAGTRQAFAEASAHLEHRLGALQHGRPDLQLLDDGAGGPRRRRPASREDAGHLDRDHDGPRRRSSSASRPSSTPRSSATHIVPGPYFDVEPECGASAPGVGDVLLALLRA